MVTEEMVEVAGEAAFRSDPGQRTPWHYLPQKMKEEWRLEMRAALAAVAPIIAKAERERCAELAETHEWFVGGIGTKAPGSGEAKAIAAAIRGIGDAT